MGVRGCARWCLEPWVLPVSFPRTGVRSVRPATGLGLSLFLSISASQGLGVSFTSFRSHSKNITSGCFSDGDDVMCRSKCRAPVRSAPVRSLAHSKTTRWRFEESAGLAVRLPRPDLCFTLTNLPSSTLKLFPHPPGPHLQPGHCSAGPHRLFQF